MKPFIGSHVKKEALGILATLDKWHSEANCFQIFLGSNIGRINDRMYAKMMQEAPDVKQFIKTHNLKMYAHLPYTINYANEECVDIIKELKIASACGAEGCVMHVGKYLKNDKEIAEQTMFHNFQTVIAKMKENKLQCKIFIETAAGQGTELIVSAEAFIKFYNRFSKTEKKYIGTCLDTAHIWGAGWDMMKALDHLKPDLVHFNNSKVDHGAGVDRHANLTEGKIDQVVLQKIAKDCAEKDIPMILETPLCIFEVPLLVKWAQ